MRPRRCPGGSRTFKFMMARAYPFSQSPTNIRKFVSTLPGLGTAQANNIGQYIPLATKGGPQAVGSKLADVYNLGVKKFGEKMHPDLKKATHFYGYYDLATADQKYLAGVIVAKRGTPVILNVTNQLPNQALIPTDPTVMAGTAEGDGGAVAAEPHRHPPARRLNPLVQRRHPLPVVYPQRDDGPSFSERARHRPRRWARRLTITPWTRAPGSCGTTTTPSASPAPMPTPASPRPCSSRMISRPVYSARSCPARQLIRWGFPWSSRIRVSCPPTFCR